MSAPNVEPQFYTRKELSIMTTISVAALSKMATDGRGPKCIKPAGYSCALYPKPDTDAWMRGEGGQDMTGSGRGGARPRADKIKRKGRRSKAEQVADRKRQDAQSQDNDPDQS